MYPYSSSKYPKKLVDNNGLSHIEPRWAYMGSHIAIRVPPNKYCKACVKNVNAVRLSCYREIPSDCIR